MNAEALGVALYRQRKAIIALVVAVVLAGIGSWITMAKQGDPSLTPRFGSVSVLYPGADADTIETTIVVPTEDALRRVAEVQHVNATARSNIAVFTVELAPTVVDTEAAWTTVERALDSAAQEYPNAADDPVTNWDVMTLQSVIVAIGGSGSIQDLWEIAEALESDVRTIPGVRDVTIVPEVARDVSITTDNTILDTIGISRPYLASRLSDRLGPTVGGAIQVGELRSTVGTGTSIDSVERIGELQIPLPTGTTVPISSIATVEVVQREPLSSVVRVDNAAAVTVGISARDSIDVVAFGDRIAEEIGRFAETQPHYTIEYVSFQPEHVALQLSDLLGSLLQGFGIVAAVVILAMGMRLGLTVATMVPVVALAGLTVFAAFGGILHQISIAALVMSLGLLVDNAIVVAERIQWRLDRGESRYVAAGAAVRELLVPLGAATGTTLAAYIPLLLARGDTAEFTGAIPRVVMLTLTLSYFFAVIVTPTIAMLTLRRHAVPTDRVGDASGAPGTAPGTGTGTGDATRALDSGQADAADEAGGANTASNAIRADNVGLRTLPARAGMLATRRPRTIIAAVFIAVVGSIALLPLVQQQFFPSTDRNQLVVDVEMAQGFHISETSRALEYLEREVSTWPETLRVASFSGRTAPRFYYNVLTMENAPYRGQLLITTTDSAVVPILADRIRTFSRAELPHASVVAKKLEQGPPVNAPIEIRISGEDTQKVAAEVVKITSLLREIPGAIDVRTTLSSATPTVQFVIDDGRLHDLGVSPQSVSAALLGATRGIPVGEMHYNDEEIPVVLRSEAGEKTTPEELRHTMVYSPRLGDTVPIAAFSRLETRMQREEISRRDGSRVASVQAQLAPGAAYNEVLREVNARLDDPPVGIDRAIGGAAEESAKANSAIAEASYLGVIVLLTILLLQFRSFRKVFIVNMTIPLAAVGVIPGLVIFNQPFGFTSMLGAIALVGIVVNNAIILIDLTDAKRNDGASIDAALRSAVTERFRPIVLTAATTIAGMVPLLFSSSSLWPPFAGAVISGLSVSTILTILVVPALYRILFRDAASDQTGSAEPEVLPTGEVA